MSAIDRWNDYRRQGGGNYAVPVEGEKVPALFPDTFATASADFLALEGDVDDRYIEELRAAIKTVAQRFAEEDSAGPIGAKAFWDATYQVAVASDVRVVGDQARDEALEKTVDEIPGLAGSAIAGAAAGIGKAAGQVAAGAGKGLLSNLEGTLVLAAIVAAVIWWKK